MRLARGWAACSAGMLALGEMACLIIIEKSRKSVFLCHHDDREALGTSCAPRGCAAAAAASRWSASRSGTLTRRHRPCIVSSRLHFAEKLGGDHRHQKSSRRKSRASAYRVGMASACVAAEMRGMCSSAENKLAARAGDVRRKVKKTDRKRNNNSSI